LYEVFQFDCLKKKLKVIGSDNFQRPREIELVWQEGELKKKARTEKLKKSQQN
jgi:hypothetical protein